MEFSINKTTWEEFDAFISNSDFVHYLTNNTTDITVAMLVLQTLIDKSNEIKQVLEED